MDYRRFGSRIIARFDRGEEILACLKEVALKENIKRVQGRREKVLFQSLYGRD